MILDLDLELAVISCYTKSSTFKKSTFKKGGAKLVRKIEKVK
jgi:hypothetical protein